MKNVWKIFVEDVKGLCTNAFALIIAIALCFLPALYAWFNIYANWDPYSNTGNIKIAVCSLDEGWTNKDNEFINMGDNIKDNLKEKDSIAWTFVDDKEKTIDGVRSGEYYAALVIEEDFTESLYNAVGENFKNPRITYYENQKKNAVATKITDTAVSTLQTTINEQYIKAVTETIFEKSNEITKDYEDKNSVEEFTEKLRSINESLQGYSAMVETFMSGNEKVGDASANLVQNLEKADGSIDSSIQNLGEAQSGLASTQASYENFSTQINGSLNNLNQSLNTMSKTIEDSKLQDNLEALGESVKTLGKAAEDAAEYCETVKNDLEEHNPAGVNDSIIRQLEAAEKILHSISESTGEMNTSQIAASTVDAMKTAIVGYEGQVKQVQDIYNNEIYPQVNDMLNRMSSTLGNLAEILGNLSDTMGSMSDIFAGVDTTLDTLNMSLEQMKEIIDRTSNKLTKILEEIDGADEEEKVDIIMKLLNGNPESYSEFFSQPVKVKSNYIYEIKNYGSGVAPFYTTLAIWVGMTILVSMVKVHAHPQTVLNPSPAQLFWGRYLLFFILSQIQALVIVLGDIFLLKIQCLYPFQFWVAAAMASLAFSMLIYSLTISFGDIGKALAVVVMVIQIAGSGGTYPIDALPGFFRAVYVFFPFPYAIDAMRECIGGMYQNTFAICMLELLIFVVAGLLIGLIIRVPFIHLNHFIEKRMEDTKVL